MANIDDIIGRIVGEIRRKDGRVFSSERVYGDEPILMRGSQLSSYLPDPIRQMRALARRPEARSWSDARLFVEQARLMAGYEDSFPFDDSFMTYFPTYEAMDNRQLRGYFTWRAQVRRGHIQLASTSFAFVFLYELINGVGAEPGMHAFRTIEAFWQAYRTLDPVLDRYVQPWLVDYVVYHGLDPALAEPYADASHDHAVTVLEQAEARALAAPQPKGRKRAPRDFASTAATDPELFAALSELSTYQLAKSRLARDDSEALTAVSCAVFESLARYYHASRAQGLVASLFGEKSALPHLMFASAAFWPPAKHEDCIVSVAGTRRYVCQNGIWTCEARHDGSGKSAKLGQVLRATDRILRDALEYPHPLKAHADPKYLTRLIEREVTDFLAWREAHAPVRVEIDLSKLAGIRSAAAATREALLVDEEREEEEPPAATHAAPLAAERREDEKDALPPEAPFGLTPRELAFVRALLDGSPQLEDGADLLVDAVNEKLFDLLGDTALEFDETGAPTVIADYADDVRTALC